MSGALNPTIAVCQHIPLASASLDENFLAAAKLVRDAKMAGADLAVLPEYSLALPINSEDKAWADRDGTYLRRFQNLAKELSIDLVPGTIGAWEDRDDGGEPVLCNNSYFIDRHGEILCTYRKKNLWHPEREIFTKGEEEHIVFDTERYGKVGLLICWDIAYPEAFRSLLKQGVQTVIAPTCWMQADAGHGRRINRDSERVFLDALCTLRAFENEIVFVFCNVGGTTEDDGVGLSQITAPFHGQLAAFHDASRGFKLAQIDYSCLKIAEDVYRVRKDVLSADFHY